MTREAIDDALVLERIRAHTRDVMKHALGGMREVALLDVPNQRNAGDSLIFEGELAYLRELGVSVRYLADIESFDPDTLRRRLPRGVVLMHGGGNFGDIWFGHQAHRERVARLLPDYRIVMLPQSVMFRSVERAAVADATLSQHPNLTLMVRDHESLARAHTSLPSVSTIYCPDAALGWRGPKRRSRRHRRRPRALLLVRADRESASGLSDVSDEWLPAFLLRRADWEPSGVGRYSWAVARRYIARVHAARERGTVPGTFRAVSVGLALRHINAVNVRSARRLYRGVSVAVVDRLHAHILAAHLGVPHVVLDNTYGKIGAVMTEYTGKFSTAHFAADLDAAAQLVGKAVER